MQINSTSDGGWTIVKLTGSLDTNTSRQADEFLIKLVESDQTNLLLDFSDLDYISSSGLRILLSMNKKLKLLNGEMRIFGMNPIVKEVFDISGFNMIFKIFESKSSATD